DAPLDLYTYEADMVAANIEHRQAPAMRWDDTLGNMRVLDRWRQEIGLVYDLEKPQNVIHTITHRPLVFGRQASGNRLQDRQDRTLKPEARSLKPAAMKYGTVPGLDKPVSRLFMGADSNSTMPDTAILFDAWFEHGGNAFDTSHGYGNPLGACERNLGQWIRNRGIRDQVVVMEKGANYPNDNPKGLTKELLEGLELLQMDQVDIYAIHRDNPDIPIGEWVDVLNENLGAGRMKVFALSNFTLPRLDAFRDYAVRRGLRGFVAVSNQFSLAQVQAPIWDCYLVSSSDAQSRAWFEKTQTPLFSWSSQARGFFTERASRENTSNPELVRCWYNEDNFGRKERAEELARKRGVLPINIALAYVLNQPFPTFPLIGPKRIAEIRSSLAALEIELSTEELRWLRSSD
ncbi:MAG TPA: aldo/keto reductase, partial [Phycisphaerae bacterium]|nr:aldo/keto reductase [Phycisphaerae bacterium]